MNSSEQHQPQGQQPSELTSRLQRNEAQQESVSEAGTKKESHAGSSTIPKETKQNKMPQEHTEKRKFIIPGRQDRNQQKKKVDPANEFRGIGFPRTSVYDKQIVDVVYSHNISPVALTRTNLEEARLRIVGLVQDWSDDRIRQQINRRLGKSRKSNRPSKQIENILAQINPKPHQNLLKRFSFHRSQVIQKLEQILLADREAWERYNQIRQEWSKDNNFEWQRFQQYLIFLNRTHFRKQVPFTDAEFDILERVLLWNLDHHLYKKKLDGVDQFLFEENKHIQRFQYRLLEQALRQQVSEWSIRCKYNEDIQKMKALDKLERANNSADQFDADNRRAKIKDLQERLYVFQRSITQKGREAVHHKIQQGITYSDGELNRIGWITVDRRLQYLSLLRCQKRFEDIDRQLEYIFCNEIFEHHNPELVSQFKIYRLFRDRLIKSQELFRSKCTITPLWCLTQRFVNYWEMAFKQCYRVVVKNKKYFPFAVLCLARESRNSLADLQDYLKHFSYTKFADVGTKCNHNELVNFLIAACQRDGRKKLIPEIRKGICHGITQCCSYSRRKGLRGFAGKLSFTQSIFLFPKIIEEIKKMVGVQMKETTLSEADVGELQRYLSNRQHIEHSSAYYEVEENHTIAQKFPFLSHGQCDEKTIRLLIAILKAHFAFERLLGSIFELQSAKIFKQDRRNGVPIEFSKLNSSPYDISQVLDAADVKSYSLHLRFPNSGHCASFEKLQDGLFNFKDVNHRQHMKIQKCKVIQLLLESTIPDGWVSGIYYSGVSHECQQLLGPSVQAFKDATDEVARYSSVQKAMSNIAYSLSREFVVYSAQNRNYVENQSLARRVVSSEARSIPLNTGNLLNGNYYYEFNQLS